MQRFPFSLVSISFLWCSQAASPTEAAARCLHEVVGIPPLIRFLLESRVGIIHVGRACKSAKFSFQALRLVNATFFFVVFQSKREVLGAGDGAILFGRRQRGVDSLRDKARKRVVKSVRICAEDYSVVSSVPHRQPRGNRGSD